MKAKDYRAMDEQARQKEMADMLREQFNLRMQKATQQLQDTSKMKSVRRSIARVRTLMHRKAGEA